MRRADRLFQIVQYLRAGRLLTAQTLSERLEVSQRTIYRDIADLQGSGVPIDGEAGVGYILREGYDLPPLMFTRAEISALVTGARIVKAWGGTKMALAAVEALVKIEAVLPKNVQKSLSQTPIYALDFMMPKSMRERLDQLNQAITDRFLIELGYLDLHEATSNRTIEPLGLYYWGKVWTLVAWCTMRNDFRSFRVDRIERLNILDEIFVSNKGKTLEDYLVQMSKRENVHLTQAVFP